METVEMQFKVIAVERKMKNRNFFVTVIKFFDTFVWVNVITDDEIESIVPDEIREKDTNNNTNNNNGAWCLQ